MRLRRGAHGIRGLQHAQRLVTADDVITSYSIHYTKLYERTAAEGASAEALRGDMMFLRKLWDAISANEAAARPGAVIYEDLPLSLRVMRDMLGDQVEKVRIDFV